jgi:hypothetical protein
MVVVGLLMIAFKLLDPTPMPRGMLLFVGGGRRCHFSDCICCGRISLRRCSAVADANASGPWQTR